MNDTTDHQPTYQANFPLPPQTTGTPPQHFAPPKKRRRWLHFVVHFIGYLTVFIIGLAIGGSGSGSSPASSEPGATVTVTKPAPPAATKTVPKATAAPSKPAAVWMKLATLSGSADKKSDTITTHGGKVRLRYTFKGSGVAAIYFLDEGTDLQKDGGVPEVWVTDPASDSVLLRKAAGDYYVSVTSTMRYTVTVEEQR
jgi:hypothetical protein